MTLQLCCMDSYLGTDYAYTARRLTLYTSELNTTHRLIASSPILKYHQVTHTVSMCGFDMCGAWKQ